MPKLSINFGDVWRNYIAYEMEETVKGEAGPDSVALGNQPSVHFVVEGERDRHTGHGEEREGGEII